MDKTILLMTGLVFIVLGVVYAANPNFLFALTGTELVQMGSITDVRATYGGFQISLGAYLIYRSRQASGVQNELLLLTLLFVCLAVVRTMGVMIDSPTPETAATASHEFNYGGIGFEVFCSLLFGWRYMVSARGEG